MIALLAYLMVALGVSFLCSILESVLMSTTLSYLTMREDDGYAAATLFKTYKTDTSKPIAAILSLNTIANTFGAAGVGSEATKLWGSEWFGLVSAITTLLILMFAEIVPKTIGTNYWRHLTGFTAYTIRTLVVVMYPLVWLIQWISKLISPKDTEDTAVSREEVLAMANVGEEEGVLEEDENTIIQNIINLDDMKAYDAMTPRIVAATASEKMTLKEFYKHDEYDHFSRIPVYKESPDFITGYVLRCDILENLAEDKFQMRLGEIKRDVQYFNEEMNIRDIWDELLESKQQFAIIIDEYGSFQGILTMEDIIETIMGLEIVDEQDEVGDMQAYARERWQQRQKRFKQMQVHD